MNRRGFTLIELSIVLVIIGLVIGGILVGKDMIRAAQLRALVGETERYQAAVNTFQTTYNCLPGDCANATDFFGTNSSGCPGAGGTTGTCNGNGDGKIFAPGNPNYDGGSVSNFYNNSASDMMEPYYFWQELALAALIPGSYSGAPGGPAGATGPIPGWDCPHTIASNSCPMVWYGGDIYAACASFGWEYWQTDTCTSKPLPPKHILQYGGYITSHSAADPYGLLSGSEMLALDTKIDDGKPQTGIVESPIQYTVESNGAWPPFTCLTNASNYTLAAYDITHGNPDCPVMFLMNY